MKSTEDVAKPKPRVRDRKRTQFKLNLAIRRLEKKGIALTFAAVANEVGVTPTLIHNTYPKIADKIRTKNGHSARQQLNAKAGELDAAKERVRDLREKLKESEKNNAKLASINETLRDEVAMLRAQLAGKVTVITDRTQV